MVLLLACLGISFWILYKNRSFYHDDAYITLRYAHNFINGKGLVWNPGEHVQGYTNFLHLVLICMLGSIHIDLRLASRLVSFAALLGLIWSLLLSPRYLRRQGKHPLQHLPALVVLTSAPMIVWALGGLEGVLYSFLCTVGVLGFIHTTTGTAEDCSDDRFLTISGSAFALAALTRPDGILFIVITLVFILWLNGKHHGRVGRALRFAMPCAFMLVPYCLWAWFYYDDLIPNTFYAKASDLTTAKLLGGARYVGDFFLTPPFIIPILSLALIGLLRKRMVDRIVLYMLVLAGSYVAYVGLVGGDHMQSYRLLLPVIPLASMLLYRALCELIEPTASLQVAVVYLLFAGLSFAQVLSPTLNPTREDPAAKLGMMIGKYIARSWPSDSLVALNTAGSTPYFAPANRYIDMLGLNDRHIARRKVDHVVLPWQAVPGHLKGDGRYVLSRNPDFIIIGPVTGTTIDNPWFLSDLEIGQEKSFYDNYSVVHATLDAQGNPSTQDGSWIFTYYERK